jgi:hypothetical protein
MLNKILADAINGLGDLILLRWYSIFSLQIRYKPYQDHNGLHWRNWLQVQWLKPIILATGEEEIRRNQVRGQWGQKVHKTPVSTNKKLSVHLSFQLYREAQIGQPQHEVWPYLKNNQHKKDWRSVWLANTRHWVQLPVPPKKKKIHKLILKFTWKDEGLRTTLTIFF